MKEYQKLNNIFGWITFALASTVYLICIEPTASWWDCGEYIATAFKLQVGHPPGAPLFQMIGRFFSLFASGNTAHAAMMVNIMSALCSGFTILFLFWSITMLAKKIVVSNGEISSFKTYLIFSAAFIGSMAYTFTDSFWFSAEEGEVYAMSSFFTALTFWAILKWESVAGERHASRWLIFIAYLIGLAIGVHLLNLLVIPATCLVWYFKKHKPSKKGIALTLALSIIILAFIMFIIIPWVVKLSKEFEMVFVNGFGLPFNTGTIVYFILLIGAITWGLFITRKKGKTVLNTILLALAFILIGYSSFLMLVIRANAGTPINENAPKDAVSLLSYLNREQYGDFPIFYGPYYSAPIVDYGNGTPVYIKDTVSGKYVVIDEKKGTVPIYDPRFTTVFPRMWSNQRSGHAKFYRNWGGEGVPVSVTDENGETKTVQKPTFTENLKYFFNYQAGWMYFRYLMWNFSGRQNDVQGFGGIEDGNWITGIPFFDKWRLGHAMTGLPDSLKNRGMNKYYMLPFLLGLIGFFYHANKDYKGTLVVFLLFIMTGLAIVVYLNQQPYEPRERDYAYAGSFYAFAMWIGIGVIWLVNLLNHYLKKEMLSLVIVGLLCVILVPGIMAKENWDDHDRSGKYACRDFAAGYLNSCDKNAILCTNGDNDTFPLWYDQDVEGIRTDVRVVNLELASGSWYINQLYKKAYGSDPLPLSLKQDQYQPGTNDIVIYYDKGFKGYIELKDLIDFIKSDDPKTFLTLQNGEKIKYFPSKKVKITVDTAACLKYGIVPKYLAGRMVDSVSWTIKTNHLYKNDLMMLDMIAGCCWKRPVYFAAPSSVSHCFNVDHFCYNEGWAYKFMPVKQDPSQYISGMGSVDALNAYNNLMNKFVYGNLNDPHVYVDPESLNNSIRPKTSMLRVAQNLNDMGLKKDAAKISDKYFEMFPDSKISYDMYDIPYAENYYRAGETGKANAIMERLAQIYVQNLEYYFSFQGKDRDYFQKDIETSLGILKRLTDVAKEFKHDKLAATIDTTFHLMLKGYK